MLQQNFSTKSTLPDEERSIVAVVLIRKVAKDIQAQVARGNPGVATSTTVAMDLVSIIRVGYLSASALV